MEWISSLPFALMIAGAVTGAAPLVVARHFGSNSGALGILCCRVVGLRLGRRRYGANWRRAGRADLIRRAGWQRRTCRFAAAGRAALWQIRAFSWSSFKVSVYRH
jgi:hypothetical protein